MFGWRGRIGWVLPVGVYLFSEEWDRVLPKGMAWVVTSLGMQRPVPEEFERVFKLYPLAAEQLASRHVGFICLGGPPVFAYMGQEKTEELVSQIQETTGIPTMPYDTAVRNALNRLSAKKIVRVTPFGQATIGGTNWYPEMAGFDVVNFKGLGLRLPHEPEELPPYASYRLAKEAFNEAPEADAIVIQCPAWHVVENIEPLEKELGIPVISAVTAIVWAALTTMHFKEPVRGYGRLLETL